MLKKNILSFNLLDGETKSSALRLAKLDYLASAPEFLKHPNLWGGLLFTGDDRPLRFGPRWSLILSGIMALFLLSLGIYLFKSKINASN